MSVPSISLRRGLLAGPVLLAGGVIAATASVPASTGCTTRQCDTDCIWISATAGGGSTCPWNASGAPDSSLYHVGADELVWQSSPWLGTWIDFPGQRTYVFIWPAEMQDAIANAGWVLEAPSVWVSTTADNDAGGGGTSTPAAGQLAEVSGVTTYGFAVTNGSCAEYYVRAEVHAFRPAQPTSAADAGE
jgi:hypothetical protein